MLTSFSNNITVVGFVISLVSLCVSILIKNINTVLPRLLGVKSNSVI